MAGIFDDKSVQRISRAVQRIERLAFKHERRPRYRNRSSGGGGTPDPLAATRKLVLLESVERFSSGTNKLPAYHWREAEFTAAGVAQVKRGGDASELIPRAKTFQEHQIAGNNLAYISNLTEGANLGGDGFRQAGGNITFTVKWTDGEPGYALDYFVTAGSTPLGTDLGSWQGTAKETTFVNLPEDGTEFYLRIRKVGPPTSGDNVWLCAFDLKGTPAASITVGFDSQQDSDVPGFDPAPAIIKPTSGPWTAPIEDGKTTLVVSTQVDPAAGSAPNTFIGYSTPPKPSGTILSEWYRDYNSPPQPNADIVDFPIADYPVGTSWLSAFNSFTLTPLCRRSYEITITPPEDRRAISIDDVNRIDLDDLAGLAGGQEWSSETERVDLAIPILAYAFITTDEDGNDRVVFERVEATYFGIVKDTGPLGTEPDYTDNRYWIELARIADGTVDPVELVTLTAKTTDDAKIVTVTNLAEASAASHSLAPGDFLIFSAVRDPETPWITRYVAQAGGALAITANVVYQKIVESVSWDQATCEFVVEEKWLEFVEVAGPTPPVYLYRQTLATDPNP